MPLEVRIVADADEDDGSGRAVEVRLTARRRADEDPVEDSRLFASGDLPEVLAAVEEFVERHRDALPEPRRCACRRCDRVFDPAAAAEDDGGSAYPAARRRPFVCRECREEALAAPAPGAGRSSPDAGAPNGAGAEVVFLGTGNAYGAAGRLPAAIFLRARGRRRGVLLDAGPGCSAALRREGLTSDDLGAVALSHFHGDHFAGLPFLELDAANAGRKDPLAVFAPPGARERVRALRRCCYPSLDPLPFPQPVEELLPGETAPLPPVCGPGSLSARAAAHQERAWALGYTLRIGGRTVIYSGDTAWNERTARLAAGADLLLHECSALDPLPGHTSLREIAADADGIRARRTVLVHCDEEVLAAETPFECAHDGLRLGI